MTEIIYREESYAIIGACIEVHKTMGSGFLESVYQECLELEFKEQKNPCCPQHTLKLSYKGRPLEATYVADFVCFEKILLEIKAVSQLAGIHRAQVVNYLRSTGFRLGLLVNFHSTPVLEYERIVF